VIYALIVSGPPMFRLSASVGMMMSSLMLKVFALSAMFLHVKCVRLMLFSLRTVIPVRTLQPLCRRENVYVHLDLRCMRMGFAMLVMCLVV
jgi:uncharacterized protein YqfA (UPF0365 family)